MSEGPPNLHKDCCYRCKDHSRCSEKSAEVEGLRAKVKELRGLCPGCEGEVAALRRQLSECGEAAKELLVALKRIHADAEYRGVWECAQIHQGPYKGPTYIVEMKRLEAAIARSTEGPKP